MVSEPIVSRIGLCYVAINGLDQGFDPIFCSWLFVVEKKEIGFHLGGPHLSDSNKNPKLQRSSNSVSIGITEAGADKSWIGFEGYRHREIPATGSDRLKKEC